MVEAPPPPKPSPGKYTVRHAVKPFGADHWQLILEGFPDGHQDVLTDNDTFKSGDTVQLNKDGSTVNITDTI